MPGTVSSSIFMMLLYVYDLVDCTYWMSWMLWVAANTEIKSRERNTVHRLFRFLTINTAEQDIGLESPLLADLSSCNTIYNPRYDHGCPGIFITVQPSEGLSNALKFGPNC